MLFRAPHRIHKYTRRQKAAWEWDHLTTIAWEEYTVVKKNKKINGILDFRFYQERVGMSLSLQHWYVIMLNINKAQERILVLGIIFIQPK